MNVKASEEMKEAETNRNEDLPSTSAANISEDLFDNDDELEDFMSQSAESAALLEKVQNSEELGVGTTPKTQKVLSEEERLSAHINSRIESNADSDEPANKAWANLAIAEKRALTVINRFNGSKAKGADLRKAISNFNVEEYKMNSTVLREWKNCLSKCMSIVQSEMQKPNIEKASKLLSESDDSN
ncbi:uncharacterized protein LOC127749231 [Frankliniella occidentalis]|uniref:Uncharacterized protein LOC127749231 n=1 Tax=Frankliniella occidentalis TaxID=133901 RepID=A0A9C6WZ73_FRAOC|nr:uncharacterized protein LOC127749231 [Frankliniella occidentalis]